MDPDRWRKIRTAFDEVVELEPARRDERLAALGGADPELRRAVETLLEVDVEADAQLSGLLPFGRMPSADGGETEPDGRISDALGLAGRTLSHFRVIEPLGAGGMGVVYRAEDTRLHRAVALKLPLPDYRIDSSAKKRFLHEARSAASLDHPNVCSVYEVGESEEGLLFLAMALYPGETLKALLEREGCLPIERAVEIARQIAQGLTAAHEAGIVHRDLKPGNVMLLPNGTVKILDFGLAKARDLSRTDSRVLLGTAAYMAPEQIRGDPVDERADLWALGVVLYEILTGRPPFRGEHEVSLAHAIVHDEPAGPSALRGEIPPRLEDVILRLLSKDPGSRHAAAHEVASDLGATRQARLVRPTWGKALARGAFALALLFGFAGLYLVLQDGGLAFGPRAAIADAEAEATPSAIIVLPFEVKGPGLDVWREGMVDLLSTNLDGVAALRAIDSRTVLARWREGSGDAGAPDLKRALEVARGTGARYAVIGNVVSSGSRMRLGAQIYSLQDENSLASLQVEGQPDSIFALVDRLSIDVLAAIWQGKARPRGQVDLARITTSSLPALKAFLEGESHLRRAEFDGAIAAYERAVAADSTFAFAWYHLAQAYAWIDEGTLMGQAFQRALRHAGRLPEREGLLIRAGRPPADHIPTRVGLLQEATRKYPDDADAWYMLGDAYFHRGELVLAGQDQSERAFRKAVELDPGFAPFYVHIVNNAFLQRPDSARVARLIDMYHHLAPNSNSDQDNYIAFGLAFGDSTRRREALAALDTLPPRSPSLENLSSWFLDHPRFWAEREIVLARRPRTSTPPGPLRTFQLFDTYLSQGKVRAALATLEDPLMLMYPGGRAAGFYAIHSAGLPVPEPTLDRELALASADDLSTDIGSLIITFYAGAYAADSGRWVEHAAAAARLRRHADRHWAAGDSAAARFASGAASALTGQGLWRRGDARRALSLLTEGQRQATWNPESHSRDALNDTIRWWIGELLLEMGRPEEAELYFESFWNDPLAADRLAGIYEQLGDRAKAREAHALVGSAWKDADPVLQPRARAARVAVQRLASARR